MNRDGELLGVRMVKITCMLDAVYNNEGKYPVETSADDLLH